MVKELIIESKTKWLSGVKLKVVFTKYANTGNTAIVLKSLDDEPMYTATVNITGYPLDKDECFIKDYSENEGVLNTLIHAGIIKETDIRIKQGFVELTVCKILKGLEND